MITGEEIYRPASPDTIWGQWMNPLVVVHDTTAVGRQRIVLVEPLQWRDANGTIVEVPMNFTCDGASIPRAFWWLVGGPLDGPYLRAAVVHDWNINQKVITWQETHHMFYRGMRADGVSWFTAKTFHKGVWIGSSRW